MLGYVGVWSHDRQVGRQVDLPELIQFVQALLLRLFKDLFDLLFFNFHPILRLTTLVLLELLREKSGKRRVHCFAEQLLQS